MRQTESIARFTMLILLIVLVLAGLMITKEYVGWATYHEGKGGYIYEIMMDMRSPAFFWSGIYGVAVPYPGYSGDTQYDLLASTGETGRGYLEANLLFDCMEPGITHEVYASTLPSSQIDFASLGPADLDELDDYLQVDLYDSLTQLMAPSNTFYDNITVDVGINTYSMPGTYMFAEDDDPPSIFDMGVLQDSSGTFVFVAHIEENLTSGFNGRLYNYEMMVPIPNASESTRYYFFRDPYDICPEGQGELPNSGEIRGTVTTETGQPIQDVIIDVAAYTGYSNSSGGYNVTVPAGYYRIYAIKSGYDVYSSNVTVNINETTIHNIVLTPTEQNEYTGVGPGQDVGPSNDIGPGEAPAVPIVEQPKMIEGTDYIISLNAIKRKLRIGNFLQEEIKIYSFRESTTQVSFEVTGDIAELIEIDQENLLVAPNTVEEVTLTIFGRGNPGIYNGTIEITGDLNASIPVSIELISSEQLPVQALVMDLDLAKKELYPNQDLRIKTELKNMLTDQPYPVTLFFSIQDEKGNTTYWTHSTNVYLRTAFSVLKTFKLPKDIPEGVYVVRVTATYLGFSSGTSTIFQVVTPFWQRLFLGLFVWQWFLILLLLLLIAAAAFIIKRRIDAKKRFHLKVDYKDLPKPGPRSGWWGKIAESDHKTYFDLEQLKIHSIVAGSTGGGKSISAQVIIEECLLKDVAVLVFDPTAQWTGMLRPCKEKGMLKYYPGFNMKPKDAKAFNGNVKLVTNPREIIDLKKYMNPGEIQIFALNKVKPQEMDIFVANTIRQVFNQGFEENPQLRLMMVYDEIHRILPKFGGSGEGFIQIERGCREFRKWGIGVMLVSQVLADFVGQIKANINTEVQMRTRDEGDLERIKTKYGDSVLKSLVKASVGSGMVQNASYNHGKPYFVTFRPILHSVVRMTDEELEKYNKFNQEIDQLSYELEQLEELEVDVFDMKLELKLSLDKVKSGNFNMVEVYLEGLRPRIKKEWEKIGKTPKKLEVQVLSDEELKASVEAAKKARKEAEANAPKEKEDAKTEEDIFRKEVPPNKILNLSNGMLVISLKGLFDELSAMKQSDFEQHVNEKKNDFADWVKDAVGDKELAERLLLKKDKQEMLDLIIMRKDKKKFPALTPKEKNFLENKKWFEDPDNKQETANADAATDAKGESKEEQKTGEEEKPAAEGGQDAEGNNASESQGAEPAKASSGDDTAVQSTDSSAAKPEVSPAESASEEKPAEQPQPVSQLANAESQPERANKDASGQASSEPVQQPVQETPAVETASPAQPEVKPEQAPASQPSNNAAEKAAPGAAAEAQAQPAEQAPAQSPEPISLQVQNQPSEAVKPEVRETPPPLENNPATASPAAQSQAPQVQSEQSKPAEKALEQTVEESAPQTQESSLDMKELSPEQYFVIQDGTRIKSLFELVESLRGMNDDEFRQYVNDEKNDFASWIKNSFHNDTLADKLQNLRSREETIHALQEG